MGPAGRTMAGLSFPGLNTTVPSFMWKRRLKESLSSLAIPAASDTPCPAAWACAIACASFSTSTAG